MNSLGLTNNELDAIRSVIAKHQNVRRAILYGSRAKGTFRHNSDIDIALDGDVTPLEAQFIAGDLEELPLPYKFDVVSLGYISNAALREHIERVGIAM